MNKKIKPIKIEKHGAGHEPLYTIGVVSRLLGCEPATLRRYESEGLVQPSRTEGNTRLYSDRNLEALRKIHRLIEEEKLNPSGVRKVMELEERLAEMEQRLVELEADRDEDIRG
jgi:MerR family transcriptional regulator, heat shock protein HspR